MFSLSCYLQETYPSSPPVWFAESEETSVTNAVQILSNTNGRDNHVINQVSRSAYIDHRFCVLYVWLFVFKVGILLRELCRLHNVPLPPDIDNLTLPLQTPPPSASPLRFERSAGGGSGGGVGPGPHGNEETDSDQDEIEDPIGESEQESEGDEDLPLEMDDVRSTNKVSNRPPYNIYTYIYIVIFAFVSSRKMTWRWNI